MFENKDEMIDETVEDSVQVENADAEKLMGEQYQTEQEQQAELTPEEYRNLFVVLREKYNRKIYLTEEDYLEDRSRKNYARCIRRSL